MPIYSNQQICAHSTCKNQVFTPLKHLHYTPRYDIIIVKSNQNFVYYYQNEKSYPKLSCKS